MRKIAEKLTPTVQYVSYVSLLCGIVVAVFTVGHNVGKQVTQISDRQFAQQTLLEQRLEAMLETRRLLMDAIQRQVDIHAQQVEHQSNALSKAVERLSEHDVIIGKIITRLDMSVSIGDKS